MKTQEKQQRAKEKNVAHVLTLLAMLGGAWFLKQRAKTKREQETGIKEPPDIFDKIGCVVFGGLALLIGGGIVIGLLVGIYDFFNKR